MALTDIQKNVESKTQKTIDAFQAALAKIRTGRAHTGILDTVMVNNHGALTPLPRVANLTLVDARTIGVQVWDKKLAAAVEKAIRESDLGLNPAAQGELIRVPMPALTEDSRRKLAKIVKTEAETAKVAARNARQDANEQVKKLVKSKDASEDDARRARDTVQKATDKAVAEIDALGSKKEAEIMAV